MERKSFVRLLLHLLWGGLIAAVLLLFFWKGPGSISGFFSRLKREPGALVSVFKPRDMAGYQLSFGSGEDLSLWKTQGTLLQAAPAIWGADETWGRVTFRPAASPGLLLTEETMGVMDWRGAQSLSFSVYNPQTWEVNLKVKVKDTAGNTFQRDQAIAPRTRTAVAIPARDIAARLDLSRVGYLNLFLWEPATATDLYLINLGFPAPGRPAPPAGLVKFMGLQFPSAVEGGEEVAVVVYFIVHRSLSGDNSILFRLRRGEEIHLLAQVDPPFPSSRWQPERLVKVGPFPVAIPATIPPGRYGLEVILAQPIPTDRGVELLFQTYDNPEIAGFTVAEIIVTAAAVL